MIRKILFNFFMALFAMSFLTTGVAFAQIEAPSAQSQKIQVRHLKNFSKFGPGLYRGGRPDGKAFEEIKALGVKTVVNLQGGDIKDPIFGPIAGWWQAGENPEWIRYEKRTFQDMGIRFVHLPLTSLDDMTASSGRGLGRILALISDPKNQPVYLHCEHGVDRTGMAVALHRVYFQGWIRQKAYDEMVEKGHGYFRQFITGAMSDFFWAATEGMP